MSKDVTIRENRKLYTFSGINKIITDGDTVWVPEDDKEDEIFAEQNTALYGTVNLANTDWTLGTPAIVGTDGAFSVNFTSNGNSYTGFYWDTSGSSSWLTYSSNTSPVMVYANGMWSADGYKEMSIIGGTDANNPDLLLWLFRSSAADYTEREEFEMNLNILAAIINEKASASGATTLANLITRAQSI